MKEILYSKYNRERKPQFQTCTMIVLENDEQWVDKKPMSSDAENHVKQMQDNYERLSEAYTKMDFVKAIYDSEENIVRFPFVHGKALEIMILEAFEQGREQGIALIREAFTHIFSIAPDYQGILKYDPQYVEVFGEETLKESVPSVCYANLDMIFENILVDDTKWRCIDYEWVLPFLVPVSYLKYRILFYLYSNHRSFMEQQMPEQEFYSLFGIDEETRRLCSEMEEHFQEYVFGTNREERYLDKYKKDKISLVSNVKKLIEENNRLTENLEDSRYEREKIEQTANEYRSQMYERGREVDSLRQELTLKYQHIAQLDAQVASLTTAADKWERLCNRKPIRILRWIKRWAKQVLKPEKEQELEILQIPQYENPKVSIVIPAYNQFEFNYVCIRSIIENTTDCSYEIILGDDVSTDRTAHIQDYIKGLIVSRNSENLRFLRNCNNAAKYAKGEYIMFLNNDTTVKPEWLSSLVELIESDTTIGMVGSKLIYPNGVLQEAGGIIWKDGSGWNYGRNGDAYQPEYNYVREVDYISGAAIMIRHDLWNEIGGFDELFNPAYCEDSDLAFEVRKHGYKVMYQPKSVVVHYEGISNGTDLSSGVKKYQVENNKKLKEKWKAELAKQYENETELFKARERNYGKKTILIIDHYVPTYDKDAGSKTTYQYIKMFVHQGYSVKFIGDNFASTEPYTTELEQLGVEVLYGFHYSQHIYEWIKEHKKDIDFVYLNRPHISEKYIDFIQNETDIKMIYYGHDLHFLRVQREAELTGNHQLEIESRWWKKKEMAIMNKVEMSYYPSYIEVDAIHKEHPELPVKAITAYVFEQFQENFQYNAEKRTGMMFVGGFNHLPNVDAVKWFVEDIYPIIREKKDIPFYIVGSNASEEIKALDGNGIVFKGFVSEEELAELYATCRLAVVPLRYGAGVKGKVVEALYNGIPIVTTSVGAEGILGIENISVVKDKAHDLAEAILDLYDDEKRLETMAVQSQDYVKANYSIDAVWDVIKDDFA